MQSELNEIRERWQSGWMDDDRMRQANEIEKMCTVAARSFHCMRSCSLAWINAAAVAAQANGNSAQKRTHAQHSHWPNDGTFTRWDLSLA